jgi:ferrochelatase
MSSPRIGVILLQLGTPEAPTAPALRRYLRQFLSDRRVIDLPRAVWLPILYGIVLRKRPKESAALYKKVWTDEGSPLLTTTRKQAAALEQALTTSYGQPIRVAVGMRYGRPSIADAISELMRTGVDRILAFPMYPQYAGATTGSSLQQLFEDLEQIRIVPSIRVVPPYFADPGYIHALAAVAREALDALPHAPTHVLTSYHGLPKRYADEGDPYPSHCVETTRLLEPVLGLPPGGLAVVYQSRFGREEWLQPYTDVTLEELGRAGARVAVMCPGFTADCLETLEEIALRGQEQFHSTGGHEYLAIPCLNTHPAWLDAMASIARRELTGWI